MSIVDIKYAKDRKRMIPPKLDTTKTRPGFMNQSENKGKRLLNGDIVQISKVLQITDVKEHFMRI